MGLFLYGRLEGKGFTRTIADEDQSLVALWKKKSGPTRAPQLVAKNRGQVAEMGHSRCRATGPFWFMKGEHRGED